MYSSRSVENLWYIFECEIIYKKNNKNGIISIIFIFRFAAPRNVPPLALFAYAQKTSLNVYVYICKYSELHINRSSSE